MKCYRLRTYDVSPPGGFPFEQTNGIYKKFPAEPLIEAQARNVASWRGANNLARATVREALEDVDRYTCRRLGGMAGFCAPCSGEHEVALGSSSPIVAPPCRGCGAPVT